MAEIQYTCGDSSHQPNCLIWNIDFSKIEARVMLQEFGAAMKRSAASLKKFGEVFQAPKTGTAKQKVRKILRHKGTLDHVLNFGSKPWHWRIVKKRGLTIVRTMRWKDFTTEIDWAKFPKNLESEEMKNRRAELYWELREKFNG